MKKNTEKRIALFPGSFDPFTRGHESVVDRGLLLFDEIVVLVVRNSTKHSLMTDEERVAYIESVYRREPRVRVLSSDGLTVDVAQEVGARCILRGVRMVQDFEYEKNLAEVYRDMSGIETVLLYTLPQHGHISSSVVREMLSYGFDASTYLPEKGDKDLIPTNKTKNKR